MASVDTVIDRIEAECELPESWSAFRTRPLGTIEVSGYDGKEMQEVVLEVISGDQITEVVIQHVNMPGRVSAARIDQGQELDEPAISTPSQVGVLQFRDVDDVIAAVDQLADPEVLAEITKSRSWIETDDPLSVREAVAAATDIDMSTVDGTATEI